MGGQLLGHRHHACGHLDVYEHYVDGHLPTRATPGSATVSVIVSNNIRYRKTGFFFRFFLFYKNDYISLLDVWLGILMTSCFAFQYVNKKIYRIISYFDLSKRNTLSFCRSSEKNIEIPNSPFLCTEYYIIKY